MVLYWNWKCRKCGFKVKLKGSGPRDGYCPKCKEYYLLIRDINIVETGE